MPHVQLAHSHVQQRQLDSRRRLWRASLRPRSRVGDASYGAIGRNYAEPYPETEKIASDGPKNPSLARREPTRKTSQTLHRRGRRGGQSGVRPFSLSLSPRSTLIVLPYISKDGYEIWGRLMIG
jgi:hypothetical protein